MRFIDWNLRVRILLRWNCLPNPTSRKQKKGWIHQSIHQMFSGEATELLQHLPAYHGMSATFCQVPCPSCQMFKIHNNLVSQQIINFLSSSVRLWKSLLGEMDLFAPPCVFYALANLASYFSELSADDDVEFQSKSVNIGLKR